MLDRNRNGKVTSSDCYKMFESATVQKTYLRDLKIGNIFKQSDREKDVFNFKWGHLCEEYIFKSGRLEGFINNNNEVNPTIFSSKNNFHCGTPDFYKIDDFGIVGDIKAPVTLVGFYNLIFPIINGEKDGNKQIELIVNNSKESKKYYYQLISNAILLEEKLGVEFKKGILSSYMPYAHELKSIIEFAEANFTEYYSPILSGTEKTLPCLLPSTDYENLGEYFVNDLYHVKFDITKEMKTNFIKTLNEFTKLI